MPICLLGLGSNLDHPKRQLTLALNSLKNLPKTHLLHVAPYYRNTAWGKRMVPDYYNTVIVLNTQLSPFVLLKHCQRIEVLQKRVRRTPNQARTLDIDILTYGNYRLMHPLLALPHPGMMERDSVQVPLTWINNTRHVGPRPNLPELTDLPCSSAPNPTNPNIFAFDHGLS